jgi:AcrR family transcriptional regulator
MSAHTSSMMFCRRYTGVTTSASRKDSSCGRPSSLSHGSSSSSVREISLGDIGRRVGLAKSNLLRYFESREDVFLRLLLRKWESWRIALTERLSSGGATADNVATDRPDNRRTPLVLRPDQRDVRRPGAQRLGREAIAAALIITAGLWPIANPAPHVTAMYAEDPALTRAHSTSSG